MRWALLAGLICLGCADGEQGQAGQTLTGQAQGIVGGQVERDHPAVGMLHTGSGLCTGTLIRPDWVLTAAHCLDPEPALASVSFNINVRGRAVRQLPVAAMHPHPLFEDTRGGMFDIAMVRLAEPVRDIAPYGLLTTGLAGYTGQMLTYVGYGVSGTAPREGSGIRRSTRLQLMGLGAAWIRSEAPDSSVCYGDSGGPGLVRTAAGWQVAGVNAGVLNANCLGGSIQIRVDVYAPWLRWIMGEHPGCIGRPDTAACFEAECADAADPDRCHATRCVASAVCFPGGPPGFQTCAAAAECAADCGDADCRARCTAATTPRAQAAHAELAACIEAECGGVSVRSLFQACVDRHCSDAWLACVPEDGCDLRGGDCPVGTTCRPRSWGGRYCEHSQDLPPNALCAADAGPACGDGTVCHSGRCRMVCQADGDCAAAARCVPVSRSTLRACHCRDRDDDGRCDVDACRPTPEICRDAIDQDCDGILDEGCARNGPINPPGPGAVDPAPRPAPGRAPSEPSAEPRDVEGDSEVEVAIRRGCQGTPGTPSGGIGWVLLIGLWRVRRRW